MGLPTSYLLPRSPTPALATTAPSPTPPVTSPAPSHPVCVDEQVVVGFAGKLIGYLQSGDLYPGVELRFMDCLPLQQSLRRTDIVTLLLQIADIVRATTHAPGTLPLTPEPTTPTLEPPSTPIRHCVSVVAVFVPPLPRYARLPCVHVVLTTFDALLDARCMSCAPTSGR
jgi:hypothetical protein